MSKRDAELLHIRVGQYLEDSEINVVALEQGSVMIESQLPQKIQYRIHYRTQSSVKIATT